MLNYVLSKESIRRVGGLAKRVLPMIGPALFLFSLFVLYRQLRGLDFTLVLRTMRILPVSAFILAGVFTALAYFNLTFVEYLSNTRVVSGLSYKKVSLVSFIAFSFSKNIGFSVLSGSAVRFRLYKEWGQDTGSITTIVVLNYIAFWTGLFMVAGLYFTISPPAFAGELDLLAGSFRVIGALMLVSLVGYLYLLKKRVRPFRVGNTSLKLPSTRFTAWQITVSAADWLITAAVLYFLLSGGSGLTYYETLGVFFIAQFAGLTSQVPGGIGVFEALLVIILAGSVDRTFLVATLLMYRFLFFIIPFIVAAVVFGVLEYKHREHVKEILSGASRRAGKEHGKVFGEGRQAESRE